MIVVHCLYAPLCRRMVGRGALTNSSVTLVNDGFARGRHFGFGGLALLNGPQRRAYSLNSALTIFRGIIAWQPLPGLCWPVFAAYVGRVQAL